MSLLSCVAAVFCRFVIRFGRMWSFNVITVLYFVLLRRFKIRSQVAWGFPLRFMADAYRGLSLEVRCWYWSRVI